MLSKRIILSIIVIGCLVQFITCPADKRNDPGNQNKSTGIKKPQETGKSEKKPNTGAPLSPRTLGQPEKTGAENKKQAEAIKKRAEAGKKEKQTETTVDPVNPDEDEDPVKEKPVGRIRKIFSVLGRLNKFRKKICPFRFVGRFIKNKMSSNKSKPTDDEESDP